MFERIDARSPVPLYAQIADRLRVAIAAGELKSGDALPSVRQLAARLRVNPATVVQAYRDLEDSGFVEMRQGAGTYVRDIAADRRATERAKQAAALLRHMLGEAARLGLSTRDMLEAIEQQLGVKAV